MKFLRFVWRLIVALAFILLLFLFLMDGNELMMLPTLFFALAAIVELFGGDAAQAIRNAGIVVLLITLLAFEIHRNFPWITFQDILNLF